MTTPQGIGENHRFERLQLGEGIEHLRQRLFLRVELHLRRAGEQPEIGIAVKGNGVAVFGIGLQMMKQHPVASVGNRHIAVDRVMGIHAHAGEGMTVFRQEILNKGVVRPETRVNHLDVAFRAEGQLQRVVAAIIGKRIVVLRAMRRVDIPLVVAMDVVKSKTGDERVGQRMHHIKIHWRVLQIDDGQFKFHADTRLACALGGLDIFIVNRRIKAFIEKPCHAVFPLLTGYSPV